MKPKPFSPLNHLTVPCAMNHLLASRGRTSRLSTAVERQTLPTPTQNSRERSTDHDTRPATALQVSHMFPSQGAYGPRLEVSVGNEVRHPWPATYTSVE